MSNCIFFLPVLSDAAYGGNVGNVCNWQAGYPITNVQDSRLNLVARSSGVATAQTVIDVTMDRPNAQGMALVGHNLTASAQWRVADSLEPTASATYDVLTFFGGWTLFNGCLTSGNNADPYGTSNASILTDDGGNVEGIYRSISGIYTGTSLWHAWAVAMKAGTSTMSRIRIYQTTDTCTYYINEVSWDAVTGVPTQAVSAGGVYSHYTFFPRDLGDGWYEFSGLVFMGHNVGVKSVEFWLYPTSGTPADTGSCWFSKVRLYNQCADKPLPHIDTGQLTWASGASTAAPAVAVFDTPLSIDAAVKEDGRGAGYPALAPFLRIAITDTGNADGYVEVARLVVGEKLQPEVNLSYGASFSMLSRTIEQRTEAGVKLCWCLRDQQTRYAVRRAFAGEFPKLRDAEAQRVFDLMRATGRGQVFLLFDSDDTTLLHERAFLGVLDALGDMTEGPDRHWSLPFGVTEVL